MADADHVPLVTAHDAINTLGAVAFVRHEKVVFWMKYRSLQFMLKRRTFDRDFQICRVLSWFRIIVTLLALCEPMINFILKFCELIVIAG